MKAIRSAAMGAALLGGALGLVPCAQATYIVSVVQDGSNVVATGSGSYDLSALSKGINTTETALIVGSAGTLFVGPTTDTGITIYVGISGPSQFGTGAEFLANIGDGSLTGVSDGEDAIVVPSGYVSGTALGTSTATWDNETLSGLGITPGTYVWNWGSDASADSFTLDIVAPASTASVPEPASLTLLGTGLIGLILHLVFLRRSAASVKAA
jgi:hypothetical protein